MTALMLVSKGGYDKCIELLLNQADTDANIQDNVSSEMSAADVCPCGVYDQGEVMLEYA